MKLFLAVIVFLTAAARLSGQYLHPSESDPGYLQETTYFRFYSHFWLNLHHFLYNRALLFADSGMQVTFHVLEVQEFSERKLSLSTTGKSPSRTFDLGLITMPSRDGSFSLMKKGRCRRTRCLMNTWFKCEKSNQSMRNISGPVIMPPI
jgi:hypothetical protein